MKHLNSTMIPRSKLQDFIELTNGSKESNNAGRLGIESLEIYISDKLWPLLGMVP